MTHVVPIHEIDCAVFARADHFVDRDNMGHYNSTIDQVVQTIANVFTGGSGLLKGNFSSPVYFNGRVYFGGVSDNLKAFDLSSGLLSAAPTSHTAATFGYPGGMFAVSANGNTNGILWAVERRGAASPGALHAYDAANLGNELYNSDQAGSRDTLDIAMKFSIPTVANGKVFVAGVSQLTVYGLLP